MQKVLKISNLLSAGKKKPTTWETKEICNILNTSICGWESASHHRFKEYGIQRSWKRITDENGFSSLPDNAQNPFDTL